MQTPEEFEWSLYESMDHQMDDWKDRDEVHALIRARDAEVRAEFATLHHPFTIYAQCIGCDHDQCTEDVHTGGWMHLDAPIRTACATCRDDDGEATDWPCETAALLSPPTEGETDDRR